MRIYALGFAAVFLLFVLMYVHAYRLRSELGLSAAEALQTRNNAQENAILVAIAVLAFVVARHHPAWSGWTYALIGPVLSVHGTVFGKKVRLLAEKES